jgi:hypothetical protein
LGKPKAFQVEEDKILAEVTLSTIYRRMPLIWKGVEEGIQGSTRSFQSKETTIGLGGRILEESGILPCVEGIELEMIRTWHKRYRTRTRRAGSTENYIDMTTPLDLSLSKRRLASTEYFIGTTTSSTIG